MEWCGEYCLNGLILRIVSVMNKHASAVRVVTVFQNNAVCANVISR